MTHIYIINAFIYSRSEANWKPTWDTQSGAGSAVFELTNQSGVGLKETGAKTEYEKTAVFVEQ